MAEWIDAGGAEEIAADSRRLVRACGLEIALFHVSQSFYALDDSCPHQGSSLFAGKVDGTTVTCRGHGPRFDLATGCMRGNPALCVKSYPVRVQEGRVQIHVASTGT
jgi:3-phenylpropionate/trans-cinnamate dioxygenase ferredoxin component